MQLGFIPLGKNDLQYLAFIPDVVKFTQDSTKKLAIEKEIFWNFEVFIDACFSGKILEAAQKWVE